MLPQKKNRYTVKVILRVALWAGGAVMLLFTVAAVVVHFIDWRQYAESIADSVKEQTGRHLEIGGPVAVGIFPVRVLLDDVTFANAPGGSRDVMVTVKRIGVRVTLSDLILGNLALRIDVSSPEVLLETVASGDKNWSISFDVPGELTFAQLNLTDGQVTFREHPSGAEWRLDVGNLLIRKGLSGGYTVRLDANMNDISVGLDGKVRPTENIAGEKETLSINGQADISGAKLTFEGRASRDTDGPIVKGDVRADIGDGPVIGNLFHSSLPALPPITISTGVAASGQRIELDNLNIVVGKSSLAGNITTDMGAKRPKIKGTISAKLIDLAELTSRYKKKVEKTGAPAPDDRQSPAETLTFPSLDMADIDLNVSVEKLLAARHLTIQNLQTHLLLTGGRLSFEPLKLNIAGADVNLQGDANGLGGKDAKFSATLNASGIDLGDLLKAVTGKEELNGGRTDVVADLRASGQAPARLISTLTGNVRISVGPGRLNNRNLDNLLGDVFAGVIDTVNPFYTEETTSELKCLVVNVPVREGILLIDDTVALETDKVGVSVAGIVNLNSEKIDLLAQPMAKEGLGIGADLLSDLVRIRGTLSKPQTEIDPVGVAKTTVFRGLDVATMGATVLLRGLTAKLSADQLCAEALRTKNPPPAEKVNSK